MARLMFVGGLAFFCLLYGFFFALTAPYLIVPMMTPLAVLALLVIWALPSPPHRRRGRWACS